MNIIYNSVPLSLHGELQKWKDEANLILCFTIEDGQQTYSVLDYYMQGKQLPFQEYTTGHEKRGVE